METFEKSKVLGNEKGRRIGVEGTADVHRSQWVPREHPGTCQVPFLLYPLSVSHRENMVIRRIWKSSHYYGQDFTPFEITDVPDKHRLAQVLACGLKATNATYSQHWEGMYFDWTFNGNMREIIDEFSEMSGEERFVDNAFATVVLMNTGYGGPFMDMLRFRRMPIPPSMLSLEQIDMGTFEHNIKAAIGSVLGGAVGVNIIRHSLGAELINGANSKGYDRLKRMLLLPGMNPNGKIASIIQIGFKQQQDRVEFKKKHMDIAAAKIIERKSERRNVDFSRSVQPAVMFNFLRSFNGELVKNGVGDMVKTIVVNGGDDEGKKILDRIRERIDTGLSKTYDDMIRAYESNFSEGMIQATLEDYTNLAHMVVAMGKKVLKPREDAHKMIFIYINMEEAKRLGRPVDMTEHSIGEAIQAGLNSIHLDGTTDIPRGEDMRYGAFCLTGPIHSAECNDSVEQLERGWGHGFWDILAPELPETNKLIAVVALAAKSESDAMIAEVQAMEQRKSVNDIFWYKTWNHPGGKKLDVPQWISYGHVLHAAPVKGNDIPLQEICMPEYLPEHHPVSSVFLERKRA
jgi:hypothetical protein